jgi:hypothetical protein
MKIQSKTLTTCEITDGGQGITLNLIDDTGAAVALRVPFEQAQSIAMTLPRLLTRAIRSISGNPESRYVFPLGEWTVEVPEGRDGLILTMATSDGFEVSFGLPAEACRSLGWTLATGRDGGGEEPEEKLEKRDVLAPPRVH